MFSFSKLYKKRVQEIIYHRNQLDKTTKKLFLC